MTLMIKSWPSPGLCGAPATGSPCDPCKPPPSQEGGLPPFTDAYVYVNQVEIASDLRGNTVRYTLGWMIIWSSIDNIPPQGGFGVPLGFGPPSESSIASAVIVYESFITIRHPYYPDGSYDQTLPTITTGPLSPTLSAGDGSAASNQAASIAAGNAAIAQANTVLGNP